MNSYSFSSAVVTKALKYDRPFKLAELGEDSDELEEILDESGYFFCSFNNCGTREYLSKKYFFNGSRFTIHFSSYEENRHLLCAPLRFLPFTRESLEMKIDGKVIPLIKKKLPLKCLESVYSLDSGQELVKFLNAKLSTTIFSLKAVSGLEIDVYDFSELTIKPGDHLRLSLNGNTLEGIIFNSEDIDLREAQTWCEKFEKSLLGVLREFGPFSDVYTQLEMTYFYGEQVIRNSSALAIRDFLKLSKKVQLADFIFQKIIWFSNNNPIISPEVEKKLSLIHENFQNKPQVNGAFYALLGEKLQESFDVALESSVSEFEALSKYDKQLQRTIRRVALWIEKNKHIIADQEMPKNEILMFEAAFNELQFLSAYYFENRNVKEAVEHFEGALEINFEILVELMGFLQEYYLSI